MLKFVVVLCFIGAALFVSAPTHAPTADTAPAQIASTPTTLATVFDDLGSAVFVNQAQASHQMWEDCCLQDGHFGCCVMWLWDVIFGDD